MIEVGLRSVVLADAAVVAIVGASGMYYLDAPQGQAPPYVLFARSETEFNKTLDGTAGMKFADFEIDCISTDPIQAKVLCQAVIDRLGDYSGPMGTDVCHAVLLLDQFDDPLGAQQGEGRPQYQSTVTLQVQYTPA